MKQLKIYGMVFVLSLFLTACGGGGGGGGGKQPAGPAGPVEVTESILDIFINLLANLGGLPGGIWTASDDAAEDSSNNFSIESFTKIQMARLTRGESGEIGTTAIDVDEECFL